MQKTKLGGKEPAATRDWQPEYREMIEKSKMHFIGPFVYVDRAKYITHVLDFLSRQEQRKKKYWGQEDIFIH